MNWDFKNNPLLRTLLVVFIGMIAFELLFNSFTGGTETMGGGEEMGNMGMNGGYGSSLGGLITGLLALLVKILMIVLVIAVIVGIIVWIRNSFFQNTNSKFVQSMKNDPILKTISVVTLTIIGIILIFALIGNFTQTSNGYGMHFSYGTGYSASSSLAGLLTLLTKVLMFVLVVSLILGVASYLKNQYDQGNLKFFGSNKNQGTAANQTNNATGAGNPCDQTAQQPNDNTGNS